MNNKIKIDIRKLFRKLDDLDFEILSMFFEEGPSTRYDILQSTKKGRINPRMNRSTLYRRTEKLVKNGFLEVLMEEPYKIDFPTKKKSVLAITLPKGLIASLVFRKDIESLPDSFQGWIKWQSKFGVDFSEANLTWNYFVATFIFAVAEFPELYPNFPNSEKLQKLFSKTEDMTQKLHRQTFIEAYAAKERTTKARKYMSKKENDNLDHSLKNLFGEDVFEKGDLTEKELRDRYFEMIQTSYSKGLSARDVKKKFLKDMANILKYHYQKK